jgi:hypothetical protein
MQNFNTITEAMFAAQRFFLNEFNYKGLLHHRNNKGIIEFYIGHTSPVVFQCTIKQAEPIKRPVGRPKGPEKVYIGFKIEPRFHAEVKAMVKEFIRIQNSLLTLNKQ